MGESLLMAAWFWYFVLVRLIHKPNSDRKCLYFMPLCPVYWLVVLWMLALPAARSNSWLLFLWAALSATGAEYLMDLFYDRVLGVSFWDYSHLPLNLHGRVCLLFSFFWGILGLIAVRLVHPLAAELVSRIPQAVTLPAALFLALVLSLSLALPASAAQEDRAQAAHEAAQYAMQYGGAVSVQYALWENGEVTLQGHDGVYSKTENRALTDDDLYGRGK